MSVAVSTVLFMSQFESSGVDERASDLGTDTNEQNQTKASGPVQAITAA